MNDVDDCLDINCGRCGAPLRVRLAPLDSVASLCQTSGVVVGRA